MKRRHGKRWNWRRTNCLFPRDSSPVREDSKHATAHRENPRSRQGRARSAAQGVDRADFPAALSVDHRTGGSAEAAARSEKGFGAGEDAVAGSGIEESINGDRDK